MRKRQDRKQEKETPPLDKKSLDIIKERDYGEPLVRSITMLEAAYLRNFYGVWGSGGPGTKKCRSVDGCAMCRKKCGQRIEVARIPPRVAALDAGT